MNTVLLLRCRGIFLHQGSHSIYVVAMKKPHPVKCLLLQFHIAGSQILLSPELYVTVIAHSPLIHCRTNQVLLQCCLINPSNLSTVLQQLSHRLEEFENEVVKYMGDLLDLDTEDDVGSSYIIIIAFFQLLKYSVSMNL